MPVNSRAAPLRASDRCGRPLGAVAGEGRPEQRATTIVGKLLWLRETRATDAMTPREDSLEMLLGPGQETPGCHTEGVPDMAVRDVFPAGRIPETPGLI